MLCIALYFKRIRFPDLLHRILPLIIMGDVYGGSEVPGCRSETEQKEIYRREYECMKKITEEP